MTKKLHLLFTAFMALSWAVNGQTPNIDLTATPVNESLELTFGTAVPATIQVDWGDGTLKPYNTEMKENEEYATATITGTLLGTGEVKIYSADILTFDCGYKVAHPNTKITRLNVSKATELLKLECETQQLTSIDVTQNRKLTRLIISGNPGFNTINLENNTELVALEINNGAKKDGGLTAIHLTKNTKLTKVNIQGHPLKTIDLSANAALKDLYLLNNQLTELTVNGTNNPLLSYVSVNYNQLKTLDVSTLPELTRVFCMGNSLTEIGIDTKSTTLKGLNITKNKFVFEKLPQLTRLNKAYQYAPQDTLVALPATVTKVDLSSYNNLPDKNGTAQATVYKWKKKATPADIVLTIGEDYTVDNGVTTFLKDIEEVYCEMSTPSFPDFKAGKVLKTSTVSTKANVTPVPNIKLEATVNQELTLNVSTAASASIQVDWGDGTLHSYPTPLAEVKSNVLGEGKVYVYGTDITKFDCDYQKNGAKVTTLDVTGAADLKELRCATHNITSLDISKNTRLNAIYAGGNPGFNTINFENNPELTTIDINNAPLKDGGLTEIHLTKNTQLVTLNLQGHKLTQIDLSKNSTLKNINLMANQLTELAVNGTNNPVLADVRVNDNKLRRLDVTTLPKLQRLFCTGNQLTEMKVNVASTQWKTLNIKNNKLVFNQLPQLTRLNNGYNYAPQDTIVALPTTVNIAKGETIDLSAYNNLTDKDGQKQATVYTWKKEGAAQPLVINEDYTINNGVTTFLVDNSDVYCEMTTPAFPKFAGADALKTAKVNVINETESSVAQNNLDEVTWRVADGVVTIGNLKGNESIALYNLIGHRVANLTAQSVHESIVVTQGIYIVTVNGRAKKIVVK